MFFAPRKSAQKARVWFRGLSKFETNIQIMIKVQKPNHKHSSSSKPQNQDFKGNGCSLHLEINLGRQNLDQGPIKTQKPYPNPDPRGLTPMKNFWHNQSPKSGVKGHWCSLHLQNQFRTLKVSQYQI